MWAAAVFIVLAQRMSPEQRMRKPTLCLQRLCLWDETRSPLVLVEFWCRVCCWCIDRDDCRRATCARSNGFAVARGHGPQNPIFFSSRWSLPTFESCQPSSCGLRGCLKEECLYPVCSQEKLFCPKVRKFHHIIMSHAVLQSVWRVMRRDLQSHCVGKTRADCSCDGGWWSFDKHPRILLKRMVAENPEC